MKRYLLVLQAAAVVMAGCSDRIVPAGSDVSADYITEIEASVPAFTTGEESKSSLDLDGDFSWQVDDKIGFWPDAANVTVGQPKQSIFYVDNVGSTLTVFKANGWGLLKGKKYYSYYPYDASATSASVPVHYNGQNQSANSSSAHLGAYDYLHAMLEAYVSGGEPIQYTHLGCFGKFTLTVPSQYADRTFNVFALSAGEDIFVLSAKYNPASATPSLTGKTMTDKVTVALNSGVGFKCNASNQIIIYMMMSPVQWNGKTISVSLNDALGNVYTGTFKPKKDQQAGRGYSYSATLQGEASATDLSASGTANCYVVSSPGEYKFKAVRGNTSTAVSVSGVKVLWEAVRTTSQAAGTLLNTSVRYENGYIFFSTPSTFKEGNAVIAAYANSGCTGDVLWSWHIWLTDTPADQYYTGAGYLMDRNLGADDPTAAGMYYQWGRKDPFSGAPVSVQKTSSSVGTVAYSIAHPTTFISADGTTQLDWLYTSRDGSLWYANGAKTAYDPCPPGYKVVSGSTTANSQAGRGFFGKALGTNNKITGTNGVFPSAAGNVTFSEGGYLSIPVSGGTALYPVCGCYAEGTTGAFTTYTKNLFVWSDYPAGTDNGMTNWNNQYAGNLDVNLNGQALTVNYNSGRAAGKSVRCEKMNN